MQEYTVKVFENRNEWHQNGKRHRLDGPAVIRSNGSKYWYQNDKLHRLDGPAIEHYDGTKAWYIEGKYYTEKDFLEYTKPKKKMTVAELEALVGFELEIVK